MEVITITTLNQKRLKLYSCLTKGTDKLLDTAGRLLDNPIILTTTSYKIIALINTTGMENPDPIWQFGLKHGYCPSDAIEEFRKAGITSAVHTSTHPTLVDFSVGEQMPRVIGRIDIGKETVAYMGVFQLKKEITPDDNALIEALCEILSIEFKQNPYSLDNSNSIQESLIKDLLLGKLKGEETIKDRLRSAKWHTLPFFSVISIPLNVSDSSMYFLKYLQRDIATLIPICKLTEFDNVLVVLLNAHKKAEIEQGYLELDKILEQNKLQAGASRMFDQLADLPRYYHQAEKSINIAFKRKNNNYQVFRYDNDLFGHLISELPPQFAFSEIVSDDYQIIKDYDEKNGGDLVTTLITFLECLGNHSRTAESLYIHRNTLRSRIEKIESLIGASISDNHRWFDFYTSYKVDEYNTEII